MHGSAHSCCRHSLASLFVRTRALNSLESIRRDNPPPSVITHRVKPYCFVTCLLVSILCCRWRRGADVSRAHVRALISDLLVSFRPRTPHLRKHIVVAPILVGVDLSPLHRILAPDELPTSHPPLALGFTSIVAARDITPSTLLYEGVAETLIIRSH